MRASCAKRERYHGKRQCNRAETGHNAAVSSALPSAAELPRGNALKMCGAARASHAAPSREFWPKLRREADRELRSSTRQRAAVSRADAIAACQWFTIVTLPDRSREEISATDGCCRVSAPGSSIKGGIEPYHRFSQAAQEVVEVRILHGIHFRFADDQALRQSRRVAHWVFMKSLRPVPGT